MYVDQWATAKDPLLNGRNMQEMVVTRNCEVLLPHKLNGVERVSAMTILWIIITSDLRATSHA